MTIQAFFEQGKVDAGKPSVNFLLAPSAVQRLEDRLITPESEILVVLNTMRRAIESVLLKLGETPSQAPKNSYSVALEPAKNVMVAML